MKKLTYSLSIIAVLILFNSCDNKASKKCNEELEKTKTELNNTKENIKQLKQIINTENRRNELLSPSIARGGKLKGGILTYELLVPKGFEVVSGPTFVAPNTYTHVIKPTSSNSRYSEINNDKKSYSFPVSTSLFYVYIHSETETVYGTKELDDDFERKHRGSIIIGD